MEDIPVAVRAVRGSTYTSVTSGSSGCVVGESLLWALRTELMASCRFQSFCSKCAKHSSKSSILVHAWWIILGRKGSSSTYCMMMKEHPPSPYLKVLFFSIHFHNFCNQSIFRSMSASGLGSDCKQVKDGTGRPRSSFLVMLWSLHQHCRSTVVGCSFMGHQNEIRLL